MLVMAAGCAPPQLCTVIPKQLELARADRDQVLQQVEAKKTEVSRSQENLTIARERVTQMQQERVDLVKKLAADSVAAAMGRKKR